MKSIRTRITLSYLLMFLGIWLVAGTISVIYVRKSIFHHSSAALNILLQQKLTAFNTAFSGIEQNIWTMNNFISKSSSYNQEFYTNLREKAILAFGDQNFIKTFYFCPNPEETGFSKCLYILNIMNFGTKISNFNEEKYADISFDIKKDKRDSREDIPWFYAAKEGKNNAWIGPYLNLNVEAAIPMISYLSPVFSEDRFLGVVGVEISNLSLRSELDNINYENAFSMLINNKGDFIYHRDFPSGLSSQHFEMYEELAFLQRLFSYGYAKLNETYTYRWQGKKHRLIFGKLTNGMKLSISVPQSEIFFLQSQLFLYLAVLIVVTMFLANIILTIVTNKIVRPIEIINQSADYIAHGELNTKIPVNSKDELGMLAASMRKIEVELSEYIEHIREMAYKDYMTGCHNKSAYLKLQSSIEKKIDEGMAAFNVYVFDVNGLKRINDSLGHEMGDALIKGAASALKLTFSEASIFRTGGDEFVVIIEDEKDDIKANISTFNEAVAEFNEENEHDFTLTVSVGTASYHSERDKDFKSVAERADKAMYEDKENFYKNHEDLRR